MHKLQANLSIFSDEAVNRFGKHYSTLSNKLNEDYMITIHAWNPDIFSALGLLFSDEIFPVCPLTGIWSGSIQRGKNESIINNSLVVFLMVAARQLVQGMDISS